jgi:hypothetical protein
VSGSVLLPSGGILSCQGADGIFDGGGRDDSLDRALSIAEAAAGIGSSSDRTMALARAMLLKPPRSRLADPRLDAIYRAGGGPIETCFYCGASVDVYRRCDHCGAYPADRAVMRRKDAAASERKRSGPKVVNVRDRVSWRHVMRDGLDRDVQ